MAKCFAKVPLKRSFDLSGVPGAGRQDGQEVEEARLLLQREHRQVRQGAGGGQAAAEPVPRPGHPRERARADLRPQEGAEQHQDQVDLARGQTEAGSRNHDESATNCGSALNYCSCLYIQRK